MGSVDELDGSLDLSDAASDHPHLRSSVSLTQRRPLRVILELADEFGGNVVISITSPFIVEQCREVLINDFLFVQVCLVIENTLSSPTRPSLMTYK